MNQNESLSLCVFLPFLKRKCTHLFQNLILYLLKLIRTIAQSYSYTVLVVDINKKVHTNYMKYKKSAEKEHSDNTAVHRCYSL